MLAAVKFLVEEVGVDVNAEDEDGSTAVHNAASRGDNEMILYLVSKGADVKKVNRRGLTTVDMANGPVQRTQPYPETIKLLEGLGAKNNNRCVSCLENSVIQHHQRPGILLDPGSSCVFASSAHAFPSARSAKTFLSDVRMRISPLFVHCMRSQTQRPRILHSPRGFPWPPGVADSPGA